MVRAVGVGGREGGVVGGTGTRGSGSDAWPGGDGPKDPRQRRTSGGVPSVFRHRFVASLLGMSAAVALALVAAIIGLPGQAAAQSGPATQTWSGTICSSNVPAYDTTAPDNAAFMQLAVDGAPVQTG